MASSSTPVHPARYLALFLVLLVGAYLLVFLTGDKGTEPKLGIDLQGGTRVTLIARTPDGSRPTRDALIQAQTIINDRVNGLGVSGSEVIIDGDNLVITVPGNEGSEARNLGQTARLYIRPVIHVMPAAGQQQQPPTEGPAGAPPGAPPGAPGAPPGAPPGVPGMPPIAPLEPGAPVVPPGGAEQPAAPPTQAPAPQPRPYPFRAPGPARTGATTGTTSGRTHRRGRSRHRLREHRHLRPARRARRPPAGEAPRAQRIADEKELRQSSDQQIQILALQFQATRCGEDDVLAGNDDPNLPLITCSQDGKAGVPPRQVDHQR